MQQIARRRQIADALMQNVLSPQQPGPGGRITPLAMLAQIGTGFLANRASKKIDSQYVDIAKQMSAGRAKALQDLLRGPTTQLPQDPGMSMPSGMTTNFDTGEVTPAPSTAASSPAPSVSTPTAPNYATAQTAIDYGVDPSIVSALMKPKEGFTLGAGQRRFDATGQQIAAVPEKPPEDYVDYVDLGDQRAPVSHRSGKPIPNLPSLTKGMTPAGAAAEKNRHPGVTLSDSAIDLAARRLLNGEEAGKVLANFGRGTQGAANITAVQNKFAELAGSPEFGMGAEDIATKIQELGAEKRARTELGAREGKIAPRVQEAINFGQIAKDASAAVPRGSFVPWSKLKQYGEKQLSDPALAKFRAANVSLINAYSAAVGGGTPTVHDKQVADDLLSTADSPEAYNAVVDQLILESEKALEAPGQVMDKMNLGGKKNGKTPPAATATAESDKALLKKWGGG